MRLDQRSYQFLWIRKEVEVCRSQDSSSQSCQISYFGTKKWPNLVVKENITCSNELVDILS